MKKEIFKFVMKCLTCQRVKAERQVPLGTLYLLEISKLKWDKIFMDLVLSQPLSALKKNSV